MFRLLDPHLGVNGLNLASNQHDFAVAQNDMQ